MLQALTVAATSSVLSVFAILPLHVARAAGADQWVGLCDALASRLAQTGMAHAASLCYICACNVDQVGMRGRMCSQP